MIRNLILPILVLLGLVGCDDDNRSLVTVSDSAGVRITLSPDLSTVFAEVEPEPLLTLGGSDASGPTQFFRVQHVHADSQNRLWVADGQSAEIRIFESDGSHWKTVGGHGEGPGEFLNIRLLGSFRGDSVAVWDNSTGRLTVFEESGELARIQRIPAGEHPPIRASRVFTDGSLLGQVPRVLSSGSLEAGQLLGDSVHLVRYQLRDSTRQHWAGALGPLWLWTGRNQVPIPFTMNAGFDVLGETVHLVSGSEFRVRVFESGEISAIYGIEREPRKVSEADIESYEAFVRDYVREEEWGDYLSALDHPQVPREMPAYSRLVVACSGLTWAQIYSSDLSGPATWDVFDELGEWLGHATTPPGFTAMNLGTDQISGVWRDELGVEHVRVYRIRSGVANR